MYLKKNEFYLDKEDKELFVKNFSNIRKLNKTGKKIIRDFYHEIMRITESAGRILSPEHYRFRPMIDIDYMLFIFINRDKSVKFIFVSKNTKNNACYNVKKDKTIDVIKAFTKEVVKPEKKVGVNHLSCNFLSHVWGAPFLKDVADYILNMKEKNKISFLHYNNGNQLRTFFADFFGYEKAETRLLYPSSNKKYGVDSLFLFTKKKGTKGGRIYIKKITDLLVDLEYTSYVNIK